VKVTPFPDLVPWLDSNEFAGKPACSLQSSTASRQANLATVGKAPPTFSSTFGQARWLFLAR